MTVTVERPHPHISLITLDDPATKNALTPETVDALAAAFDAFDRDRTAKVAIVAGRGGVFCSGGNTKTMGEARPSPLARKEFLWTKVQRLIRQVDALDKPLLAAVGGPAVGAGADLALHADIRLMARTAYLRESYVDLGVVPGAGGAFVLPRLVGTSKALELLWTGRKIGAEEAVELGLAARAVEADELIPATLELAESIAAKPLQVLQMLKRMVRASSSIPLGVALDLASSNFAVLQETADHAEGIRALRERRSPDFHDE